MQQALLRSRTRLIILSVLIGLLVGSIAPHACHAESIKTRADLLATLIRLRTQYPEWSRSYKVNVNDCSDMTSRLHRILTSEGYTAFIAVGYQLSVITVDGAQMRYDIPTEMHAKILCYVWADGKVEATWVEATGLLLTSRRFIPRHIFNCVDEANKVYGGEF
jgi:hypothetical protein